MCGNVYYFNEGTEVIQWEFKLSLHTINFSRDIAHCITAQLAEPQGQEELLPHGKTHFLAER